MVPPIKLLIVVGNLDRGGAEKQLALQLSHYDPKEIDVQLISLSRNKEEYWCDVIRTLGIRFHALPPKHTQLCRFKTVWRVVTSWRPDVVWAWHFFTGVYAVPAVRLNRPTKLVLGLRNDAEYLLSVHPWAPLLFRVVDAVVANNKAVFTQLSDMNIGINKKYILSNIVDSTNPAVKINYSVKVVGYCGNIHKRKGLDLLLHAAKIVVDNGFKGRFIIAGKGEKRDLMLIAQNLNIKIHVDFIDKVDCNTFMRQFDIFVLPSRHEGCPNVLLEALSNGIPSVATRVGGVEEIITHGENGLLVEPENPDGLADALIGLEKNFVLRQKLSEGAVKSIRENHDPQKISSKSWVKILRSICAD